MGETSNTDGAPRRQQGRSKDTKDKILAAAVDVLIEHGYAGASTLRIQHRAQVSRGRLLHHYPSREHLLIAAVHHLALERIRFVEIGSDVPDTPRERIRAAIGAMWSNYSQPFFWAANELWNAARTDPELQAALRPVEHQLGQVVRAQTDALFGPEFVAHAQYRQLREVLITSMRGVAVTYAFDPRDPTTDRHLDEWADLADTILRRPPRDRPLAGVTPS